MLADSYVVQLSPERLPSTVAVNRCRKQYLNIGWDFGSLWRNVEYNWKIQKDQAYHKRPT
jgi:hypothetical protein